MSGQASSSYSTTSYLTTSPTLTVTYSTLHRELCVTRHNSFSSPSKTTTLYLPEPIDSCASSSSSTSPSPFFTYLSTLLANFHGTPTTVSSTSMPSISPHLEFRGGLMGYIGY